MRNVRATVVGMDYLSTLDAGFLQVEDSDPHVSLAVGALAVLEGPMPDYEGFVEGLRGRLGAVPRFKQVLRTHQLDLGAPAWADDDAFDLDHHVRRAAVPQPGDERALFRLAADLMERRLDRDHPLWECWLVEGLGDGRWAILMKIHHCIADGIAVVHLLSHLSDKVGTDALVTDVQGPDDSPHNGALSNFLLNPLKWINGMWHSSFAVTEVSARAFEGTLELAAALIRPADASGLSGPVTGRRRYAAAHVPLKDVAKVRRVFDVTINDVALAAITDSYRAALIRRGDRPNSRSLRTLVPVSVRPNELSDTLDNRVSLMLPYLPVDESDPVQQLQAVHTRLTRAKTSGQRQAGSLVISAMNRIPFALTAWTVRALARLPQRGVVTVATNVPGPRSRLRVMGCTVVQLLPILPLALEIRTGIAIVSYADDLVFGITADYDAAPDVEELATGIEHAVARLAALSVVPRRSTARRTTAASVHDDRLAPDG